MFTKRRKLWILSILVLIFTLACSCPMNNMIDEIMGNVETIETMSDSVQDILTEIPAEDIIKTAESMITEMPVEEMEGMVEEFATEMPAEELMATAEASSEDLLEGLDMESMQQVPEDIPVVDGDTTNFMAMAGMVTYGTPMAFQDVVNFYQSQMVANGWQYSADESVTSGELATLTYHKDGRSAYVTISSVDGETNVMIMTEG